MNISRRDACRLLLAGGAAAFAPFARADDPPAFKLNYVLASALYGKFTLDETLSEVKASGSTGVDIWCLPHGNQREQINEMGIEKSLELFKKHQVEAPVFTRYGLGPFGLDKEAAIAKQFGAKVIVTGSGGKVKEPVGAAAREAVAAFLEAMKPRLEVAAEHGIKIAVENHVNAMLCTPDSLRAFAELNKSPHIGVAFAPHHLFKNVDEMPKLIEDLGSNVIFFYAQEHGEGSKKKVEKEIELKQLPGLGTLDYAPLIAALKKIRFTGYTEIFMHPTPRGVPILPTVAEITQAVNKSRAYLDSKV